MSYDLLFWRQQPGEQRPPDAIANSLLAGETVAGLYLLPVENVVARVQESFPLTVEGGLTYWEGGDSGMFEIYRSPQHMHFCCRQLIADHCNALIDIMAAFDCPLYDPQINERFDGGVQDT